jgi:hypothetical protein
LVHWNKFYFGKNVHFPTSEEGSYAVMSVYIADKVRYLGFPWNYSLCSLLGCVGTEGLNMQAGLILHDFTLMRLEN